MHPGWSYACWSRLQDGDFWAMMLTRATARYMYSWYSMSFRYLPQSDLATDLEFAISFALT
jgi:hypothetical protein